MAAGGKPIETRETEVEDSLENKCFNSIVEGRHDSLYSAQLSRLQR